VQYDYADLFVEGRAVATKGAVSYLIDKTGKVIVSGDFFVNDQLQSVTRIHKGEKDGLMDISDGKFLLQPIYTAIFKQGLLAAVKDVNGKYGLYHIGLKHWIIPLKNQDIYLRDNCVIVQNGQGKHYYSVSARGKLKEEHIFDRPPEEELLPEIGYQGATFNSGGRTGYIWRTIDNQTGRVISIDSIPAMFESIEPDGIQTLLIAKKDGKSGMIDMKGKIKIPFLYDEIKAIGRYSMDSIYAIKKDDKWGLTRNFNILLPCQYDEIVKDSINGNGFYLKQRKQMGFYVHSDAKKLYNYLIPCKYEQVISYIYTIGQPSFCVLRVSYNGWKDGFVDMRGNEFFK